MEKNPGAASGLKRSPRLAPAVVTGGMRDTVLVPSLAKPPLRAAVVGVTNLASAGVPGTSAVVLCTVNGWAFGSGTTFACPGTRPTTRMNLAEFPLKGRYGVLGGDPMGKPFATGPVGFKRFIQAGVPAVTLTWSQEYRVGQGTGVMAPGIGATTAVGP